MPLNLKPDYKLAASKLYDAGKHKPVHRNEQWCNQCLKLSGVLVNLEWNVCRRDIPGGWEFVILILTYVFKTSCTPVTLVLYQISCVI